MVLMRRRAAISFFLFFVLFLLVATPFSLLAQDQVTPSSRREPKATVSAEREKTLRDWMETVKERRKEASKAAEVKREEFRRKVAEIKDQRKKFLVEKLGEKVNQINTRRTEHFLKILERLSKIAEKVDKRIEAMKAEGRDTTSAEKATAAAKDSIEKTRKAVVDQAAKVYTLTITEEKSLRTDVGKTVNSLQQDLKKVAEMVRDALKKTQQAFVATKEGGQSGEPTSSE